MTGPFPESAAELRARARETPSPVDGATYGYFLAKSGELFGNREVAERCRQHWGRFVAPRYDSTKEMHPVEGVASWRSCDGELSVCVVARDPSTGQVTATRLDPRVVA